MEAFPNNDLLGGCSDIRMGDCSGLKSDLRLKMRTNSNEQTKSQMSPLLMLPSYCRILRRLHVIHSHVQMYMTAWMNDVKIFDDEMLTLSCVENEEK